MQLSERFEASVEQLVSRSWLTLGEKVMNWCPASRSCAACCIRAGSGVWESISTSSASLEAAGGACASSSVLAAAFACLDGLHGAC